MRSVALLSSAVCLSDRPLCSALLCHPLCCLLPSTLLWVKLTTYVTVTASCSLFLLCRSVTGVDYETYPFFCETTWDPAKGNHCAQRGCRQYNDMATIFLSSRENSILSLVGASCSCPQPPLCALFSLFLPFPALSCHLAAARVCRML